MIKRKKNNIKRKAVRLTHLASKFQGQNLSLYDNASIITTAPKKDIYNFSGLFKIEMGGGNGPQESLSLENTMWANTYLTAGQIVGLVIYVGKVYLFNIHKLFSKGNKKCNEFKRAKNKNWIIRL